MSNGCDVAGADGPPLDVTRLPNHAFGHQSLMWGARWASWPSKGWRSRSPS